MVTGKLHSKPNAGAARELDDAGLEERVTN